MAEEQRQEEGNGRYVSATDAWKNHVRKYILADEGARMIREALPGNYRPSTIRTG
ncbi:MAG: hypothetical protein KKF56_03805 [Nanoarchaeota archaeon]|nr:hypothetical protein [Nanoarchaeota archaeon]